MSDTINPKPEFPQNPQIEVVVRGVHLLCFSEKNQRAEIGFLKVEGHPLTLEIYEANPEKLIYSGELAEGSETTINPGGKGMGYTYRPLREDDRDFQWVIDFDKWYDKKIKIKKRARFFAKLYIHDAVFYSAARTAKDAYFKYKENGTTKKINLKRIARGLGAAVEKAGGAIIQTDGAEKLPRLSRDKSYKIVVSFECLSPNLKDFMLLYKVIENLGGKPKYELEIDDSETAWFSDFEYERFTSFARELRDFLQRNNSRATTKSQETVILAELEKLSQRIRCDAQECLGGCPAQQPRDLWVD